MASRAVFRLSACAAALAAGCAGPSRVTVDLTARFDTPARAASAVRLEVELLRGGCGGASVLDAGPLELVRGEAAASASVTVPPGTYCARARAFDRSCVEFARGETTFTADRATALALELRPADARRACPQAACSAGRCRAAALDAGLDAPRDADLADSPLSLPDVGSTPPPLLGEGCTASGTISLSAGESHTCAVVLGRGAYCWGRDDEGRLGAGEVRFESRVPVAVAGGIPFEQVSAGGAHTCGLAAGQLYCWGANTDGQLGIGTIDAAPHPVPARVDAPGLDAFLAVATGARHTCAVASATGTGATGLYCWGANDRRQLGTSSPGPSTALPQPVDGLVGLLSAGPGVGASSPTLAAGDHHTCVITDRTTSSARDVLSCFGEPGAWSGTSAGPPSVLFDAPAGESLGDLDLGARHGCVTAFGGSAPSARCWGLGGAGRLGTGSTADAPVPLAVEAAGSSVLAVAGGADFSCLLGFLAPSFAVQCVGAGARGATGPLGVGRDALAFVTALDPALPVFTGADLGLDAGANHVCAPVPGALVCWGDNRHGQLGTGAGAELDPTPARVCFD